MADQFKIISQLDLPQSYGESEALVCYRKAAEQGCSVAQSALATMYKNGKGVARSYKEALVWYRKAAEQGDAVAQSFLGLMYKDGQGVTKSYKEALAWFRKAAKQGDSTA